MIFSSLFEGAGDLSCLMVDIPKAYAEYFKKLQNSISRQDIYEGEGFGLETEFHVTVLYGIHTKDSEKVFSLFRNDREFEITLGEVTVFKNPSYDVLKIDVSSPELHRMNREVRKALQTTVTFSEYHPHLTLGYLKPGCGKRYCNPIPARVKIPVSTLCFSIPPNRKKTYFRLRSQ